MALSAIKNWFSSSDEDDDLMYEENDVQVRQQLPPLKEEKQFVPLLLKKTEFTIVIATPLSFEQARECADSLLAGKAVLVDFTKLTEELRSKVFNYLNGVVYIERARVERVTEQILLYAPKQADLSKMKRNSIFNN